ncbi:MAG TPA: hypothetical protein PKA60_02190 [Candidatus Paceibacterota bacterium]|nr:hypothetical protein [Candidatus Paceibacterota bacterium]
MIKDKSKNNKENKKEGFTLLFAVLVSVLILAVGSTIINLAIKQIIISGSARESQYAFYASNTGIECAIYWDLNQYFVLDEDDTDGVIRQIFPPAGGGYSGISPTNEQYVNCAGINLYDGIGEDKKYMNDGNGVTTFWLDFSETEGVDLPYCAYVVVTKNIVGGAQARVSTVIDSYGYNTCDENNPRRIERGLRVQI